ncbi:MAG: hypothetical protein P8R42_02170 [Candidatus Binatia bacterium]|nr:hypothetical protein [Candidatus Binatia bacterium]
MNSIFDAEQRPAEAGLAHEVHGLAESDVDVRAVPTERYAAARGGQPEIGDDLEGSPVLLDLGVFGGA